MSKERSDDQKQNKRTQAQIRSDRALCSKWYRQGYRIPEIHLKLNQFFAENDIPYTLTYHNVLYDIKQIINQWHEEAQENISKRIEIELSKLDLIETEMWKAWEDSKRGVQRQKAKPKKKGEKPEVIEAVQISSPGDTKFITRIQWCIEMRAKLLGFFVPTPEEDPKDKFGEFWDASTEDVKKTMTKFYSQAEIQPLINLRNQ